MSANKVLNNFQVTMPLDRTADFGSAWCQKILADPTWEKMPFGWMIHPERQGKLNEFWVNTLSTHRALRAVQGLKRTNESTQVDQPDVMMLMSLGEGLAGAPGRLHGGFTATALDMIMGFAVNNTTELDAQIHTATLKIDYKAPVICPSVTMATGKVTRREGRKTWVMATLEDGHGMVYASAEALFVRLKEKI